MTHMPPNKKYTIKMSQKDLEVILEALGLLHNNNTNNRIGTKPIDIVFEKIYRALGVRLG